MSSLPQRDGHSNLLQPSPPQVGDVTGWKTHEIRENNEPLVDIGLFSGNDYDRLFDKDVYFGGGDSTPYERGELPGSRLTISVRQGVADRLLVAESLLPSGMHLVMFNGWRSLENQQSLYDYYSAKLIELHPDWSPEQIAKVTQDYVSLPSADPTKPSPHNTGGSIDVAILQLPEEVETQVRRTNEEIARIGDDLSAWQTVYHLEMRRVGLINAHGTMLDFGTPFDHGEAEAAIAHFEELASHRPLTPAETEARDNRRLLQNVMREAGFESFASEWWHFNFGNQMAAQAQVNRHLLRDRMAAEGLEVSAFRDLPLDGQGAVYGAARPGLRNELQEQIRVRHQSGIERLYSQGQDAALAARGAPDAAAAANGQAVLEMHAAGLRPGRSSIPQAARIAPAQAPVSGARAGGLAHREGNADGARR